MKLIHIGAISTGLVIIAGIALVIPAILVPYLPVSHPIVLSFEIKTADNLPGWCNELASQSKENNFKGVIFIPGEIAQQHPECITLFENFDVGSSTARYSSLENISDYTEQLELIKQGKSLVDKAGNIDSRLFRAPYGYTDQNIYSLLTRSGIEADFSYDNQYNFYHDGQFVRYDLKEISENSKLPDDSSLVLINFDNSESVDSIIGKIQHIKESYVDFKTPSDLVGKNLTIRGS